MNFNSTDDQAKITELIHNATSWRIETKPLCDLSPVCAPLHWRVLVLILSSLVVMLNGLHYALLHKMRLTSNFSMVVKSMAICDLFLGVFNGTIALCSVQKLCLQNPAVLLALRTIIMALYYHTYLITAVGLLDRYIAVCHPTRMQSYMVRNWIYVVVGTWLICFAFASVENLGQPKLFCVNGLNHPLPELDGEINYVDLTTTFTLYFIVMAAGGVFFSKIRQKLAHQTILRGQSRQFSRRIKTMKQTVRFLKCVVISYITLVSPALLILFLRNISMEIRHPVYMYIGMMILNLGPIVNSLIYGWLSPSYKAKVKEMLGLRESRVESSSVIRRTTTDLIASISITKDDGGNSKSEGGNAKNYGANC